MNTEAVVNTANTEPAVYTGCDKAIYDAAGYDELLKYRKEHIGSVPEGEAFITPGFGLQARYIIHAVSPVYRDGKSGEEEKLRSCYRKSLEIAKENHIASIAFPLISTGGFGYPREEGMRIAVDEINGFLLEHDMDVYLVVFDEGSVSLGERICPGLDEYIDRNYVEEKTIEEYGSDRSIGSVSANNFRVNETAGRRSASGHPEKSLFDFNLPLGRKGKTGARKASREDSKFSLSSMPDEENLSSVDETIGLSPMAEVGALSPMEDTDAMSPMAVEDISSSMDFEEEHMSHLEERMEHLSDTFSQYLMYLIQTKHLENTEVYKRAIVDRKIFSKIKNNPDYHPQKITALCLCIGAKLNLDESRDLLARAGYALSPCDKTDIIFSYFIENKIYDMIELDIQLEEHDQPCIIT
ncbi:MAG: macro domain-containing protein [Lachnospiraceae bacterium]|nr:macro domain-containing protein [Lachnospiraceae bacterium]